MALCREYRPDEWEVDTFEDALKALDEKVFGEVEIAVTRDTQETYVIVRPQKQITIIKMPRRWI